MNGLIYLYFAKFMQQARQNIVSMLRKLLEERRASEETHNDMLAHLMNTDENKYKLSDEEIIDQIITILYSGYETVSTTSMMAVKYLHDHPRVLQELRVSQQHNHIYHFQLLLLFFEVYFVNIIIDFSYRKNIWQSERRKGRRIHSAGMTTNPCDLRAQ